MPGDVPATSASPEVGSLRSGQEWAAWLRQAFTAPMLHAQQQSSDGVAPAALTALAHFAQRQGFGVEHGASGGYLGVVDWLTKRIRIPAGISPGEAVTAFAHQLGHVLLHEQTGRLNPSGAVPCHGLRKVEADSVAYLIAAGLGIETPAIGFPYVTSWAGTDPRARPAKTIEAATARILTAAGTIATHLDSELTPGARRRETASRATAPGPATDLPPSTPLSELIAVNQEALAFYISKLPGSWVSGYLTRRGFPANTQQLWQAGYAPASWAALTGHLRDLGWPDTTLEAAGLARRSRRGTLIDTFRDRAILPIHSSDGIVIAFIGRAPDPAAPGVPKYLNSPQTALYDKSDVLFGLWQTREALAAGAQPVVVEGPFDAIAVTAACAGRKAGVAPCGTAFTTQHAHALSQAADLPASGVLVAFDPDQAGRRAAVRAYHLLAQLTTGTTSALLPAGSDPAHILASDGLQQLDALLAETRPLADVVTDAELERWSRWLPYADGRINALRAAAPVVAAMPPAHVARQVARLAEHLALDHATVTDAVTAAVPDVIGRAPPGGTPGQASRGGRPAAPDFPDSADITMLRTAMTAPAARRSPARRAPRPSRRGRVPG
jgi:DNA primase